MNNPMTVGASDVAAILGLSKFSSPGEAWARLTGRTPRYTDKDDNSQAAGRIFEGGMLAEWGRRLGLTPTAGPPITEPGLIDLDEAWRHVRPDGHGVEVIVGGSRDVVLCECKKTRSWDDWSETMEGPIGSGLVPVYYDAQVAWQASCRVAAYAPPARVDVMAYNSFTDEVRHYRLWRNREVEQALVEAIRAWMLAHVWATPQRFPEGTPPGVLARVFSAPSKAWLPAEPADLALHAEALELRARMARDESRVEAIKATLCATIGDNYGIEGVARWAPRKGAVRIDAAALKAELPDVHARFAKVGEAGRTFTFLED